MGLNRATAWRLGARPVHFPGWVLPGSRKRQPTGWVSTACPPRANFNCAVGGRLPEGGRAQGGTRMISGLPRPARETPKTLAAPGSSEGWSPAPREGPLGPRVAPQRGNSDTHSQDKTSPPPRGPGAVGSLATKEAPPGPPPLPASAPRGRSRTLEGTPLCGWAGLAWPGARVGRASVLEFANWSGSWKGRRGAGRSGLCSPFTHWLTVQKVWFLQIENNVVNFCQKIPPSFSAWQKRKIKTTISCFVSVILKRFLVCFLNYGSNSCYRSFVVVEVKKGNSWQAIS